MAFSASEIENAQKSIQALTNLQHHRKELEIIWAQKNEKILEPTDINFPDIEGFTLLDYAIILQDMDQIQQLISEGAKSNKASDLAKRSENEAILQHIPTISSDASNDPNTTLFHLAAQLNFDTFHEKMNEVYGPTNWGDALDTYDSNGYTPLMIAIEQKNFPYIKYLVEQGCDVNKLFKTAPFTAIDFALFAGNIDVVNYLKENGARLDLIDHEGKCLLSKAIMTGNIELVKFALLQEVDYTMTDFYGRSPVHFAASCTNPEIIELILKDKRCEPFKSSLDLLGRDPFQVAINHDNHAFISQMEPTVQNREKRDDILIAQGHLIKKLKYYLRLTNQNPDTLSAEGLCNGLEFLSLVLTDKGKQKDFLDTLKIISKWAGSYEGLDDTRAVSSLIDKYTDVKDLFRLFSDHAILLQQSNLDEELTKLNPSQKSRKEQYAIIGENDNDFSLAQHFSLNYNDNHASLNEAQLAEYITILSRLPNTKVSFGGSAHATSLYITDQKNLFYYDPNIEYELASLEKPETVAGLIKNFKYKALHLNSDYMLINITAYHSRGFSHDTYSFFKENEIPQTIEEANSYQNNSPNKFTHLHVAVLTDSISDLKKILMTAKVDVNAKDDNGDTALDLAIMYNKPDMLAEILNSPELKISISTLNYKSILASDHNIKELLRHAIGKMLNSENDYSEEIKALLLRNTDDYTDTILVRFLKENYLLETTKQLARGNVNQNINELMNAAAPDQIKEFLVELIRGSPDINIPAQDGIYPIHAFAKGNISTSDAKEVISALHTKGVDVNGISSEGETPLISALKKSRFMQRDEFINWLIDSGANVNTAESQYKITPLFLSLFYYGNREIAEKLLEHGANVNHQIYNGACVLHQAVLSGDTDMVKMLLKYGADFTIKDENQKSPLTYAIENNHEEIIKLFTNKKLKITEIVDLVNQSKTRNTENKDNIPLVEETRAAVDIKDTNPLSLPVAKRHHLFFASHEIPESLSWFQKALEKQSHLQADTNKDDHESEHVKP